MMKEHTEAKRLASATATSTALLAYSFGGSDEPFKQFAQNIGLLDKEESGKSVGETENTAKNIEQSKRLLAQVFEEK